MEKIKLLDENSSFDTVQSKIDEVNAVLGGESSGGLTVRGHIHGKDSIYAASLFAEMVSVIGKSPSEIIDSLLEQYGHYEMVEDNLSFEPSKKEEIVRKIMVEKQVPEFHAPIKRIGYEDGCKVYFEDDSFVSCRFSGTEPLLRIFAEADNREKAKAYIDVFKKFVNVE